MRNDLIPNAIGWILKAEYRYGMYDDKTARVRRYFFGQVEPDRFDSVDIPAELIALGYNDALDAKTI